MRSATRARVVDVLARAAGALAVGRGAVVVELQRHADDVVALGLEQRGRHRGVDAAGHGDDDAGVLRPAVEIEGVAHGFFLLQMAIQGVQREPVHPANLAVSTTTVCRAGSVM